MSNSGSTLNSQRTNARLGLFLFAIYSFFYLSFTLVNAFAPEWAEWQPAAGINLAIWWGFGLIGLAFLLALIYGIACKDEPKRGMRPDGGGRPEGGPG